VGWDGGVEGGENIASDDYSRNWTTCAFTTANQCSDMLPSIASATLQGSIEDSCR
jgi:hypothetical protein